MLKGQNNVTITKGSAIGIKHGASAGKILSSSYAVFVIIIIH